MKDHIKIELHEFVAWTENDLDAVITVDYFSDEVKCVVKDNKGWYDIHLSNENKQFIIAQYDTLLHYEVQTHSHEMYDMNVLSLHVHVNNKVREITK